MCSVSENCSVSDVAAALAGAKSLVVTSHVRPDGDALGCTAALACAAQAAGIQTTMFVNDVVPLRYAFFFEPVAQPSSAVIPSLPPTLVAGPAATAEKFAALAAAADRVVVVDTSSFAQLEPIADQLRLFRDKLILIDHHLASDDLGRIWRDVSAPAAGVMVLELIRELGWQIPPEAARALLVAILTDTGWLRYQNTSRRAVLSVAELIDGGPMLNDLYQRIYQSDRSERLKLLSAAHCSMQLFLNNRLAIMCLTPADFARTGATPDETEDFVNEPMKALDVVVSILLTQQDDGRVRASLRSRNRVDVAALAGEFGGGGHARAAGFRSDLPLDVLKIRLVEICQGLLEIKG